MKNTLKRTYKTVLSVLGVLIILALLALPAVYTNTLFGYLPICVGVCLLLISGVYLLIMKRNITLAVSETDAQTTRGQQVKVQMKVSNKSVFVCPRAKAEIYISDYFGNDDSTTETYFTLDSKSTTDFSFDITMEHVGVYTAGIRSMRVYDLLGVFSITLPFDNGFSVIVLPQIHDQEMSLSSDLITDSPDASSFSENDGFDYTGVREYVVGDSMKRIHWKLSAHSFGYMTKVNEVGKKSDLSVVLDTVSEKYDSETLLSINDSLMETALSGIAQAQRMDIEHSLMYIDKENQLVSMVPRSEYDYIDLVRNISTITSNPDEGHSDAECIVLETMQLQNRSANLLICTSKVTEGLLQALISVKAQQRNPILYYVMKPDANEKDRREAATHIRMLDEFGIYYEVVSAKR